MEIAVPGAHTFEEMLVDPMSHHHTKQNSQGEYLSIEADSRQINTIKNNVPSPSSSSANYSSFAQKTREILIHFGQELGSENFPLISSNVAIQLLKIQSRFLDNHPFLCTSRFRHTLHQLSDDNHQKLDQLCHEMHNLLLEVNY